MPGAIAVTFRYVPGIRRDIFDNLRLTGDWDANGRLSAQWTSIKMMKTPGPDQYPEFKTTVLFDPSQIGTTFRWGVWLDGPAGKNLWGIATEIGDGASVERYRSFTLTAVAQEEVYYLTDCHRFGAQKDGNGFRFSVWAPNAENVEVVFGDPKNGYIDDNGGGIAANPPPVQMSKQSGGVWESPILSPLETYDHIPYMFRVTKKGGQKVYRTDLYSRCQIGSGDSNPDGRPYNGKPEDLVGAQSCSVVVNPETVVEKLEDADKLKTTFIPEKKFWASEFDPDGPRPPARIEDMIIYELHVGSLGYGWPNAGTFKDLMDFIGYLTDLGVNAVELLPMSEFKGIMSWGYGTSHYFALEFSAGGRDNFKHVIRALHRKGIAVIMDVCYNHYSDDADRAEWMYDTNSHEDNSYYWYEGRQSDYKDDFPPHHSPAGHGGYVDNESTGYSPRFWEENVRKMFISSAVSLMENFHIDGFRLDLINAMHRDNRLHYDRGRGMGNVNQFGAKFLREYSRTLRLINPGVILIAEDHSGWEDVTRPEAEGGMGFGAAWYADFHHHLGGGANYSGSFATLTLEAGYGDDRPLKMDYFAGALGAANASKVVYHKSHDEAGNAEFSGRTMSLAVNWAPLVGDTRIVAEARSRFAAGMALLSGGVPMFFMGEETGAAKVYTYNDFKNHREDIYGDKKGVGARMFLFYKDMIAMRLAHPGLRSQNVRIIHTHNANRVIVFHRWGGGEDFLVFASLNNVSYQDGYNLANPELSDGRWREIFNSDSAVYGGQNIGSAGGQIISFGGAVSAVIPARGFVVFQRQ